MAYADAISVLIARTAKPGREADFERALHTFVQRSLSLPGQQGVHIVRPAAGSGSREYGIVRKFSDRDALAAFRRSPEYREWNRLVSELTEGSARTEELTGLESWFTPPNAPLRAFPKWKLAIATYTGVFPTVTLLNLSLGRLLQPLPFVLSSAIFNAGVVLLLTWLVMPLVTRVLNKWLKG